MGGIGGSLINSGLIVPNDGSGGGAPPPPAGLAVGYWNPQSGQPDVILPVAAPAAVALLPNIGSFGAWTQITPGEAADLVILGANVCQRAISSTGVPATFYYQLGTGAAGSEVVIEEFQQDIIFPFISQNVRIVRSFRLAPVKLAAGVRLSARSWEVSGGSAAAGGIYVSCIPTAPAATWAPWTDTYIGGTRALGQTRTPAVAATVALPTGPLGAWVEMVAATAYDALVTAVQGASADTAPYVIGIGTGAAGSEVLQGRAAFPSDVALGVAAGGSVDVHRKIWVPKGSRIACRMDWSLAFAAAHVALYLEQVGP